MPHVCITQCSPVHTCVAGADVRNLKTCEMSEVR